jgi:hypothetical protein
VDELERRAGYPSAEAIGDGWVAVKWTIETRSPLGEFQPPWHAELEGRPFCLLVEENEQTPTIKFLAVCVRQAETDPWALAIGISALTLQSIAARNAIVAINHDPDHPVLHA